MTLRSIPVDIRPPREDDDRLVEPPPASSTPDPLPAIIAWPQHRRVIERPIAA